MRCRDGGTIRDGLRTIFIGALLVQHVIGTVYVEHGFVDAFGGNETVGAQVGNEGGIAGAVRAPGWRAVSAGK